MFLALQAVASYWISEWSNDITLKENFIKDPANVNLTFNPDFTQYERFWIYAAISFLPSNIKVN
jgi:hypothetical protein